MYMKGSFVLILMLASGLVLNCKAARAQEKTAVIAFQVAVAQTNEGQRMFADLQMKYEPKRAQLKALNNEIDSLKSQLQTQSGRLSDAERTSLTRTIEDKQRELQRSTDDAQKDFQNEMQQLYNGVAKKVYDVLSSYAQQQGYTLVLDVSQQSSPVLFASASKNITKQVIDAYNLKSGIPAPPAESAGIPASNGSTVHEEVEKIRSGSFAPMPSAQLSSERPAVPGRTMMTVQNSTAYQLSVFYDGPASNSLSLAPGETRNLELMPGAYHVAGRVSASDVLPFYGEETYASSASYSVTFYISTR